MSNIWKVVKLDFSLIKKYFISMCFTVFVPIIIAVVNRSLISGISFAMCYIAMASGYTFYVVEKNSMERLYGILPISKSTLVIGRYAFTAIMELVVLGLSLIVQSVALSALGETISTEDIIVAVVIGIILFAIFTTFQLPGYYKFGYIKGKYLIFIPVAGFLATLFFFSKFSIFESSAVYSVLNPPIHFILITAAVVAVMYILSMLVSIKILKNKEV